MTVGERIIEARNDKGWGRPKLAEESRVPYPTLAGLESGDQRTSTAIPALAVALGVNALWLSQNEGPKHPPVQVSQSVQWDFPRLALAHQLLREAYADAKREAYSVESEPEALIETYLKLVQAGDDTAAVVAVGRNLSPREKIDEHTLDRASRIDPQKGRKRTAG